MRLAFLLALLISWSFPAHAGERCANAPLVRVAFKLDEGGHMLTAGSIAGRRTWLVVDTGGMMSLVGETLVRELRLKPMRATVAAVDAAGVAFDRHVTVPAMALGTKSLPGPHDALIMQLLGENAIAGGTLGLNVLSSYDLEIDNATRTLALFPQRSCKPAAGIALAMLGSATERAGLPIVQGTLDGAPARVLIDTGSTATYVDRRWAKHYFGLTSRSEGVARAGMLTTPAGNAIEAWSYIFKDLTIGGLTFKNLPALITDLPGPDVTLGQAQLQTLTLHFAFAEGRVYVSEAKR